MIWFVLVPLFLGCNLIFWGIIGAVKFFSEDVRRFPVVKRLIRRGNRRAIIRKYHVAAIVPAHNEERVIEKTILSLLLELPKRNIHVISDGSTDRTALIARSFGVNVVEFSPANGKAGALEKGIAHFNLLEKFRLLLFVDADTVLSKGYVNAALPYFRDPNIAALAGYARTLWDEGRMPSLGKFFVAYRERVYFLSQTFIKFGQTWSHLNVAYIIPGFASIYRSAVLPRITLNPKGLVIEDFNMTFEVHRKHLGKIAFNSRVSAYTQDPDNFSDYWKQVKRWDLGFWQTVRLHGFFPGTFSLALGFYIFEVILSSIIVLALLPLLLFGSLPLLAPDWALEWGAFSTLYWKSLLYVDYTTVIIAVFLTDYALTLVAAIAQGRPSFLIYGIGFLFMRVVDAFLLLSTLPRAFLLSSKGIWTSPKRR